MIKVGINGYGVIGKRVAHAVELQDDMKLVGVAKTKPDFNALTAIERKHPLYCSIPGNEGLFRERGLEISGSLNDLLKEVDIVIDGTPGKFGAENKALYEKAGIKAIFEGGEKASTAQVSFNAFCNYNDAIGKDFVRVVSCNTTGLARTIGIIKNLADIGKIRTVLIRRAADPVQSKKGPINAIVPVAKVPSHHGPDLKTVLPCDIISMAVAVPTTIMHLHTIMVELKNNLNRDELLEKFRKEPRIKTIRFGDGFRSTAEVMEYARNLSRDRSDMYEICVWEESMNVKDGELYFIQAIHQESDVVPENIDAIRAMNNLMSKEESMLKTNKSLNMG